MPSSPKKPDSMVRLGHVIRDRRKALGVSQDELAGRTKLHRNYIGGIERAERNITILSLIRVAEGLDTTSSQLLIDAGL